MIRLQTLGSLDLRAADGAVLHPVLRQSKRLALLAYLAIEKPGQFHRRDQLLGLFWPEADLRGARASLSQAVHFLRQYLGKDAIINRGDEEIGLAPERVWCDAAAFQAELAAGRCGEAMALYGGDLLPGVFLGEADGFEQWLEQKRDTLRREAMHGCALLADTAAEEGRHADVAVWLRRGISHFPYDEGLHRRLIVALDQGGDRAAALRAYDELEQTLRSEFEAEPSAETKEVILAVRARSEAMPASPETPRFFGSHAATRSAAKPARRGRQWTMVAGITLVISAVVAAPLVVPKEQTGAPANRIAVLFFRDVSPESNLAYLADGLTSNLIAHLGQVERIEVISENGVRPFRDGSVPVDSISRFLDVGTVVGGSVSQSGGRFRITIEVIEGATGVVKRTRNFERPSGELFALLDDMSKELGGFLRSSLGEQIQLQRWQAETQNIEAWQLVQRAQHLRSAAEDLAREGELTASYAELNTADSLLAGAMRLDARWTEPVILRGRIAERRSYLSMVADRPPQPGKWLKVATDFANQALRTDRRSAAAYELRGLASLLTSVMGAAPPQSSDSLLQAAETDLRTALSINSAMPKAQSSLSAVLFAQGRYEEARRVAVRALEADAYLTDADEIVNRLFTASFEVGDDAEAGLWCDEVRRRMPNRWPAAYCDLVLLGWSGQGRPDPRKALLLLERSGTEDPELVRTAMRPRLMLLTAAVLARAGDADSARAMIRTAKDVAPHDPELLPLEAGVRLKLDERQESLELLRRYLELNPAARSRVENGRMFRSLREQLPTVAQRR